MDIRGDLVIETSDGRTVKLCEWIEALEKRVAALERQLQEQPIGEEKFLEAILKHLYCINLWSMAIVQFLWPKKKFEELLKSLQKAEEEARTKNRCNVDEFNCPLE